MDEGHKLPRDFSCLYLHVRLLPLQISSRGIKFQYLLVVLHLHAQPAAAGSYHVRLLRTTISLPWTSFKFPENPNGATGPNGLRCRLDGRQQIHSDRLQVQTVNSHDFFWYAGNCLKRGKKTILKTNNTSQKFGPKN